MTLRELMTAIALHEQHHWTVTVNGFAEGWRGVPYSLTKYPSGPHYQIGVAFPSDGTVRTLDLTADPSPTADPLDAELRDSH
jgi:hypothetical protein